jgi:MFS family permease
MWLLSPRFGAATHRFGTRTVMTAAAALAGGGLLWTGLALDDTWSWWDMAPAGTVFGVGLACGAAPLTQAAVTSVSSARAGLAAAFNHAVVRAAGLAATIWLGSVASGGTATMTTGGVRTALFISAAVAGLGGLALVLLFKEREPGGVAPAAEHG